MKRLIALASFLALVGALTDLDQWQQFKSEHGKSYKNDLEEQKRFNAFSRNLREIEKHNKKFEQSQTTYKMGLTRFSDWTEDEIDDFFRNIQIPSSEVVSKSLCGKKSLGIKPPASVDWREKNVITEVKDQGDCSSGWAFAAVDPLETQLYYFSAQTLRTLSAQALVDCFGAAHNKDNNGCNEYNGTLAEAYDFMIKKGFAFEKDYPYVSGETDNSGECQTSKLTDFLREYKALPKGDEVYLQEIVAFKSTVAVQIDGRHLTKYKSGILDADELTCSKEVSNHAAAIVGYGTENGTDFWILKNSWGAEWGENGYFRLRRGFNVCGVANAAVEPVF